MASPSTPNAYELPQPLIKTVSFLPSLESYAFGPWDFCSEPPRFKRNTRPPTLKHVTLYIRSQAYLLEDLDQLFDLSSWQFVTLISSVKRTGVQLESILAGTIVSLRLESSSWFDDTFLLNYLHATPPPHLRPTRGQRYRIHSLAPTLKMVDLRVNDKEYEWPSGSSTSFKQRRMHSQLLKSYTRMPALRTPSFSESESGLRWLAASASSSTRQPSTTINTRPPSASFVGRSSTWNFLRRCLPLSDDLGRRFSTSHAYDSSRFRRPSTTRAG